MEKLLTLQEVLELIRVSYSTLRRWMNAGTFPQSVNRRGKLLFIQSSIAAWMCQQSESVSRHTPTVTTSKERRQAEKSYQVRQEAALATLERHRKAKVNDGN